jgi:hypothetical protein
MKPLPEWLKLAIPMILTGMCLVVSCSIIIAGYIVPSALNQGYLLTTCQCGQSYIQTDGIRGYVGDVDLTYKSSTLIFTFKTYILSGTSETIIKTYLDVNYAQNSTVICYVSPSKQVILVTMFNTYVALGFCIAFVILSVLFFLITCICCCRAQKRRRSEYIDLTKKEKAEGLPIDNDWALPSRMGD